MDNNNNTAVRSNSTNVIGNAYVSDKKHRNGLDEFDLWAIGVGTSERELNNMRPKRHHLTV